MAAALPRFATARVATVCVALVCVAAVWAAPAWAGAGTAEPPPRGLVSRGGGAFPGYTLIAPLQSTTAYLLDLDGRVVHEWRGARPPGASVYLLDSGNLLRTLRRGETGIFQSAGAGGRIEEVSWTGELVWELDWAGAEFLQHHDVEPLPNGNLLLLAWERKGRAAALAAGRDPRRVGDEGLWVDYLVEIEPRRPRGGRVVWEWHVWDHLVQERDPELAGYGSARDQPGRIDLNAGGGDEPGGTAAADAEIDRLRALGYLGTAPGGGRGRARRRLAADWTHANAVAYNQELDQILVTVRHLDEIWVIDHGTTTAEAAGSTGGRLGRGGELLYRWGNPAAWGAAEGTQTLFAPHDAQWIPPGHPGAGNILIFNNGQGRPGGQRSSVDEIRPPLDADGAYARPSDGPFGPAAPLWSHDQPRFYSARLSGAQRLANGNTLICAGEQGRVFEVTPAGERVWEYLSPFGHDGHQLPRRPSLSDPVSGPIVVESGEGRRSQFGYSLFRATRLSSGHAGLAHLGAAER